MLFLYRPRQTWMPYRLPRANSQQAQYNRSLQDKYAATRQVAPAPVASAAPAKDTVTALQDLAQLHESGAIDDDEFAAAKAKVLSAEGAA